MFFASNKIVCRTCGLMGLLVSLLLPVAGMADGSSAEVEAPASTATRIPQLIKQMSLEEKVALLQNNSPALPRLGLPAYEWWNEGLHGVARDGFATVFPQAIGLAATWDTSLLYQVGEVISTEARAKFNMAGGPGHDHGRYEGLTIWAPNINIFRDPRWGRGMETFGEDPYLTGQLGVSLIQGLQGPDPDHPRAIATPKHLAVHSGPEAGRHGMDIDVSPHDLEDTYLPAFRAAVVDGHAGSVMCAVNALHGVPVCADPTLMTDHLRKDWGFNGFTVSDCDAIDDMTAFHYYRPDNAGSSAAALVAGTDLNCGNAYAGLLQAVQRGEVKPQAIDQALARLLRARFALGELQPTRVDPYAGLGNQDIASAAHRAIALNAALESLVLLENKQQTLPLKKGVRIAVIGPNADSLAALEANYQGTSTDPVTPLRGLRHRFGTSQVTYAQGASLAAEVPVTIPETALRHDGRAGLQGEYFDNDHLAGRPRVIRDDRTIEFNWDRVAPAAGLRSDDYSVRWTGELVPPGPGDYVLAVKVARCFDCTRHDTVRLYVDDHLVIAGNADDLNTAKGIHNADGRSLTARLTWADGQPHRIRLESLHGGQDQGLRLQWIAPAQAQLEEMDAAIQPADAVIAFVGLSPDVEGEQLQVDLPGFSGGDRTDIGLPATQRAMLERAKASRKPLIVVLMSGSAVALTWAKEHADAVIAAWYPGEQGGDAVAQVLAGDYNPGGRLPVTFYRSTSDLPPFVSYAMAGRTYRYFHGSPLYPFGYGLSYTQFDYSEAQLSAHTVKAGDELSIQTSVRNVGHVAGDEVAQLYLVYPSAKDGQPRLALAGFSRIYVEAGASRKVNFTLTPRLMSLVDAAGKRDIRPGAYRLFIGGGQPDTAQGTWLDFEIVGTRPLPR